MAVTVRTGSTARPTTRRGQPQSLREIGVWATAAGAVSTAVTLAVPHLNIGNDGYQYLGVAENLLTGHGITTDLPFFDVEQSHGVLPAPFTTQPPGYPFAIAGLRLLGLPPVGAAVTVSVLAVALTVLVLGLATRTLQVPARFARPALLAFAVNPFTLTFAGSVLSEALFTLLVTGTALGLVAAQRTVGHRRASVLAGVALGLSVWVRYAGLFVVVGTAVGLTVLLLLRRDRRAAETLAITVGVAAPLFGALLLRNVVVAGSWRGGNTVSVDHPVGGLVLDTADALLHLVIGDASSLPARAAQAVLGLAALVGLVVLVRRRPRPATGPVVLLGAVVAVYGVLMFEAGLVSVISYGPRMFFPLLPTALLLLALLAAATVPVVPAPRTAEPPRRGPRYAGATAVAAIGLLVGVLGVLTTSDPPPDAGVAQRLAAPVAGGDTVPEWLDARLGPDEPVLAADGQATGYVLRRPVVGLVESTFSDLRWNEDTVAATMDRFDARYLVLYRHPQDGGGQVVEEETPFLRILLAGRPVATLTPVAVS
ncbi:hypothetical protein, partial [Pseudonocardia abyssalis]